MKNLGQVTENQDIARKQDIPTNTNQLTNGAGFITSSAIIGKVDKIASTDNAIARFDGTGGAIQNSKVTVDDDGVIYSNNTKVALTSDLTNVVKTTTTNTFTANNIFKNNGFEIRANSASDDSWIKLTNATDAGYYAFGIRRPYDMYGLQMKIHQDDGSDQYIDILHAGNYNKYVVPTSRKVNGNALSGDITLTASDVGALPSSTIIPTALSQLSADATHRTVTDTEKATWNSKSSFSGSYTDLTNKPTIPTVNNGTLTIQKNGTNVATFTANQSTNATANITVPTKTSDLTNDSGFITSADLPSGGGVTSVVGKTGDVTADQIKTAIQTTDKGFAIGYNASAGYGGAIGNNTSALTGGAVGYNAETSTGGAVGYNANTTFGAAVGQDTQSTLGGAVGYEAKATTGFAGGSQAQATADGAVQLGYGTNATTNTLQFRSYQLLNASGNIPKERLSSTSVTSVVGQTGDITASQIKSGIQTSSGGFAIGNGASAGSGFAGGNGAVATDEGVAIGDGAKAYGRAIQLGAGSIDGEDENDALKVFDKILMSYGYIHPEVYVLNKLVQTTSGNGNNYIRRSDGLLIQWGRVSRTQQTQTINFPSSLQYVAVPTVFVTQNQGGTNNNCFPACIGTTTSTSFTVNTYNNNGAYINWLAIGWCYWTI